MIAFKSAIAPTDHIPKNAGKVLIICARLPLPLNTGAKIRAFHVIKSISSQYNVTLGFFYANQEEEIYFNDIASLGIRLIPVYNPKIDKKTSVGDVLANCINSVPVTVAKYWHPEMANIIKAEAKEHDIIHCEHLHMAQYLSEDFKSKTVLDAHNVEWLLAQRCFQTENNLAKKCVLWWNYRKLKNYEALSFGRFDMVFAVSDLDRLEIERMGARGQVVTIENGVDVEYFQPNETVENGSLVFVGSMDWMPNDDGMHYFIDEIFPLLVTRGLNPQVYIVGREPSKELEYMAKRTVGITVTGTVDDVRPYVEKGSVYIVPLRFGGGTRLKILEAFAMKKAVVSTSLGCEGIECTNAEHLIIADTADTFADSVELLLDDANKRRLLAKNAYNLIAKKYSWNIISENILAYYGLLLEQA